MSYALLFPGQASQHPAMLPWLEYEPECAATLNTMEAHIGAHWRATLQDPVARQANAFAQILMTGTSIASWQALSMHLDQPPAAVAGYSVGELAAFTCAGVLAPSQAIDLAVQRARAMDAAAREQAAGLLSVSGVAPQWVLQNFPELACAIHIDADHGIFGGAVSQLDVAEPALAAQGASCKRLPIAIASHTRFMQPARMAFEACLQAQVLGAPRYPLVVNTTGVVCRSAEALKTSLSEQLDTTVQWAATMDTLAERGVRCVLEMGAGCALARLWMRRHPGIAARSLDDFNSPQSAADWVQRHQTGS